MGWIFGAYPCGAVRAFNVDWLLSRQEIQESCTRCPAVAREHKEPRKFSANIKASTFCMSKEVVRLVLLVCFACHFILPPWCMCLSRFSYPCSYPVISQSLLFILIRARVSPLAHVQNDTTSKNYIKTKLSFFFINCAGILTLSHCYGKIHEGISAPCHSLVFTGG